ncbi:MAG: hypothetical protein ACD_81C00135G0009 [uncultured bacterium]|uniref:Uncharacterized protein n=2 Tax=Candidatus Wolfeibacteriota TaxID=1752735 RepID=A0A0G1H761_9BACT|nr:MAG: hypothetical protein ACD_81C00135G0009 [uncultured bacterium]KKR12303.1 MAG: hypothetical protein UT41_C0002G0077 [Candidatus Wolfebacteria bacterium GW2011_GWC2_39_22]KKT43211.1 MAG: hypothetical protein UW32_C0002G0072 [Candidatus Wolfebacteria bacterium GW2011_GWE2_44_13]HBI25934.1 hypothetical protein [Candidatus Wolfebacteria bacterium]
MHKSKFVTYITAVVLTVGIGAGLSVAADWAPPVQEAPASNAPAPINVGANAQTKDGPITFRGIIETTLGGIKFPDGTIQTTANTAGAPGAPYNLVLKQTACQWISPAASGKAVCPAGQYMAGQITDGRSYCCNPTDSLSEVWDVVARADKPVQDLSNWSNEKTVTWVADAPINGVRVSGDSNDGGYCYASWGTGHVATYLHDGRYGYYNVNRQSYSIFSSGCPTYPPSFSNDGVAKICQAWRPRGTLPTRKTEVDIPAGTVITLKSNFMDGVDSGLINCKMEVKRQ